MPICCAKKCAVSHGELAKGGVHVEIRHAKLVGLLLARGPLGPGAVQLDGVERRRSRVEHRANDRHRPEQVRVDGRSVDVSLAAEELGAVGRDCPPVVEACSQCWAQMVSDSGGAAELMVSKGLSLRVRTSGLRLGRLDALPHKRLCLGLVDERERGLDG